MKQIGATKYKCDNGENIRITFASSPKDVVQIRQMWDEQPADDVDFDTGIRKPFNGSKMRLVLTFGFIQLGTCVMKIGGSNGVVDIKEVISNDVTMRILTFVP